jgi:hypothetical protein
MPSASNSPAAPEAPPALELGHLRTFAAWQAHGPATVHQLAAKADLPLIDVHPRTLELLAVGALEVIGQATTGPIYAPALTDEINAPTVADLVERKLNTLDPRDQVSIAAGIMARHGRRGAARRTNSREQSDLPL